MMIDKLRIVGLWMLLIACVGMMCVCLYGIGVLIAVMGAVYGGGWGALTFVGVMVVIIIGMINVAHEN